MNHRTYKEKTQSVGKEAGVGQTDFPALGVSVTPQSGLAWPGLCFFSCFLGFSKVFLGFSEMF